MKLKVDKLYPDTVDVLRFYLGSLKINELELSNIQFANKIYRGQILELIREQRVQHCTKGIVYCDIHAMSEFIIQSMVTLKYMEIDEVRPLSASNEAIKHFGQSKEFVRSFVKEDFGSVDISPRWDVIVFECRREQQRLAIYDSMRCDGETLKLELQSYLLERYLKLWRNGATSLKIMNSFVTIPMNEQDRDLEFKSLLRLCSKMKELKVEKLHHDTVDVLRFYLGSVRVNKLELSNIHFSNKIFRDHILELIRVQHVQHCSISVADCDIKAMREFIIAAMVYLEYLKIEEFRQFPVSNEAYPTIKYFGQSIEFMNAFEWNDFGSVNSNRIFAFLLAMGGEVTMADLPPDVILKILEAGQESIDSVKLLSHEWLLSSEEHLNDRKKLPTLDSFRWHISDKGTTTLSMRYPAKYHNYFGIKNWQFGPIPFNVDPKQIVKVNSRPLAAKVVAREVFAPRLSKLFGRCSRVRLLELSMDVFEQETEVDMVQCALRDVPLKELALMRQRELDDQAMDAINDLVDALCPTDGIVISALDYEVDGLNSRSFYLFLRKLFKHVSTVKCIFGTAGSKPQPFWQGVINSFMDALKVRVTLEQEKFDNGKGRVALTFEERHSE